MNNISRFIIIDDDPIYNYLCQVVINRVDAKIEVKTFTHPDKGLEFIISECSKGVNPSSIIFLDLNMPAMTGWQFLGRIEDLDEKIKEQLKIYIHTSSTNHWDEKKAGDNKNVIDFIVKPITKEVVKRIIDKMYN
jgi:two-component SAPR family response regulator